MKKLEKIERELMAGRLKSALELLLDLVNDQLADQPELRTSVIRLLARYNDLRRRKMGGTIADGEAMITENQIRYGTLDFLEMLKDELQYQGMGEFAEDEGQEGNAQMEKKHKILFLLAEPLDQMRLRLGEEVDEIKRTLASANISDRFELVVSHATSPQSFLDQIIKEKPTIVHFSGHGSREGIVMLDKDGNSRLVANDRLADVFKLFREVVGCVVLNACYAGGQAESIKKFITHVIGTTGLIPDTAARNFSVNFYKALGEGHDMTFAYEFAKAGAGLESDSADLFHML